MNKKNIPEVVLRQQVERLQSELIKSIRVKNNRFADRVKIISVDTKRLEKNVNKLNYDIAQKAEEINSLKRSFEYRLGFSVIHPVRATRHIYTVGVRKLSSARQKLANIVGKDEEYFVDAPLRIEKTSVLAVVIHLFYTDNWKLFAHKLLYLKDYPYDLFITLPESNAGFGDKIKKTFPNAYIIIVPNRGRDVLPFIKIAQLLERLGYESILKFHSKKSSHRDDGQDWLEDMITKLLPSDPAIMADIHNKLRANNTGIIGPAGVYYPLTVNFPANGVHMTQVIKKLYSEREARMYLQVKRNEYGFFGGTMFWARLDAISSLLNFPMNKFEIEAGQIDGTLSHSLERLFSVVPEIEKRDVYEIGSGGVVKRPYMSKNIPDWSKDHLK